MPGAQQRGVHLSMHALYDPPLDRWINGFLDRWLATDTRIASRAAEAFAGKALSNWPPPPPSAAMVRPRRYALGSRCEVWGGAECRVL